MQTNYLKKLLYKPFFIKLMHWEYWPSSVVYAPMYLYWVWLCIQARSFFFFNTSNPTIKNGGLLMESKMDIYNIIPPEYYPPTLFCKVGSNPHEIIQQMQQAGIALPVFAKPDIGGKGKGVEKLFSYDGLAAYTAASKVDFLLQAFVPYKKEVGIFYYRLPNEERGKISGIVSKEFLSVQGNGVSTIEELAKKNKRYILQQDKLNATLRDELHKVLPAGETRILVPYGNHARGAKFLNASALIDDDLVNGIDKICRKIPGFYYGRLDIMYNDWDALKQGTYFSIIEINGAGSEPTHIYDPCHSIFFAWKEIMRHWKILQKVSMQNKRKLNIPYMPFKDGIAMFKENAAYEKIFK